MEDLFREKLKLFLGSFIAWLIPATIGLFGISPLAGSVVGLIAEYTFRFFGAIIIGFGGAIITVMAKDFYDIKIKKWYHKKLGKKKDNEADT